MINIVFADIDKCISSGGKKSKTSITTKNYEAFLYANETWIEEINLKYITVSRSFSIYLNFWLNKAWIYIP